MVKSDNFWETSAALRLHEELSHDPVRDVRIYHFHIQSTESLWSALDRPNPSCHKHLDTSHQNLPDGNMREVILATNFTAEGEATAHVIGEGLKKRGIQVTRLARGVPVGSELEFVDLGTIAHALVDRRDA